MVVEATVEDPIAVVDRVAFDLAVDGVWVRTATVSRPPWVATFAAEDVWPRDPGTLEVRARVLGRRGGLLLELGVPFAKPLEILTPAESAVRRRDFARTIEDEDRFPVTVGVAAEGRVGSASRTRIHIAVLGPVSERVELKLGLSVGPNFAEPNDLAGGGPLSLGAEIGARVLASSIWFADAVATADVRFPGFDPGGAVYVGARGPWGPVGWEISGGGGALAADATGDPRAAFFGALRVGVRFGSTDTQGMAKTEP